MAVNVTEQDVLEIMDTALTAGQLAPFLRTAETYVTERLGSSSGYSDSLIAKIITNYAAHLATAKDPELDEEQVRTQTKGVYRRGPSKDTLDRSSFGQTVKELDFKQLLTIQRRTVTFMGLGPKNDNYPDA